MGRRFSILHCGGQPLTGAAAGAVVLASLLAGQGAESSNANTASTGISFGSGIKPVVEQYCFKCHSGPRSKGGIDLGQFKDDAGVYREPKLWQAVIAQLEARDMPPEGKPQPSDHEREQVVSTAKHLLDNLDQGHIPKDPGRVLIHRLSRLEYNNTVRDLFGVSIKPADKFPADGGGGAGFDNIADTLFVPPILMERLLGAADEVLAAAETNRWLIAKPHLFQSKRAAASRILEHLAPRAYRRPVEAAELDSLTALFDRGIKEGRPFTEAVKLPLKAMLVSPHFLFRVEADQPGTEPYRISEHELASRLSYYLWSSMPDGELFKLAREKRLNQPAVLETQVRRMLRDPKADVFAENFVSQWLRVRDLATTAQPDTDRFPTYTPELRDAMMQEPVALFRALLREDRSLIELLDADYSYVNETLARHYGITNVTGSEFRRVALQDKNRGGVMGMAGVLTLTSYPARTSPVLRGKWVLEEILGTPPPPPPPQVKTLPRDDSPRQGLTFRQQLERHRADPSCASCHKRMDPLGLGLENFDPIGRWRTEIKKIPVDASGTLVTGETFTGPAELKKLLLERRDLFLRNITEKMLSYALGRGVDYYDTPTIKGIAQRLSDQGCGSSMLVSEIVKSYPFQYRRNSVPGGSKELP